MKTFKNSFVLIVLVLVLIACSSNKSDQKTDKGDALKIAIISSPSGVDDGSFNQEIYNGVLSYLDKNKNASVTPIKEATGAPEASVQAVADVVADYDVLIGCGFQFAGIGQLAADNPDKTFILVDAYPINSEGITTTYDNVYAMTFAENESGFYAGVIAALETKTNKVAVVNGIAFPSNVNYQYGFEAGVNYANKKLGTKVEVVALPSYAGTDVTNKNVGGNYVGNFNDEAGGKVLGKALIDQGVDIILIAAGGSGNGVIAAAKEASNVMVIGGDVDQYKDGVNGSSNVILSSALKIMSINVDKQLTNIETGNFKGENALLTAAEGSTGYAKDDNNSQLSAKTKTDMEKIYQEVVDKTIIPPDNFSETTTTDFKGLN
ncbi:MAG: BMP family lipoprotein [Bacilli bacterium]